MKHNQNICLFVLTTLLLLPLTCSAFSCYITMVKNSCWKDYNVNIEMIDVTNEKKVATLKIPKNTMWVRQSFECSPKQTFRFAAAFNPRIWENDSQSYKSKRYWSLPESTAGAVAWNMTLCYPDDFAEVPVPPSALKCRCDKSVAPPIPNKKSS